MKKQPYNKGIIIILAMIIIMPSVSSITNLTEYQGSTNTYNNRGTGYIYGQSFQLNQSSATIEKFCFNIVKGLNWANGKQNVAIRKESFTGTIIYNQTFQASTLPNFHTGNYTPICEFTLSNPLILIQNTQYYLTLRIEEGHATDEIRWGVDSTTPSYGLGQFYSNLYGNVSTKDRNFVIQGENIPNNLIRLYVYDQTENGYVSNFNASIYDPSGIIVETTNTSIQYIQFNLSGKSAGTYEIRNIELSNDYTEITTNIETYYDGENTTIITANTTQPSIKLYFNVSANGTIRNTENVSAFTSTEILIKLVEYPTGKIEVQYNPDNTQIYEFWNDQETINVGHLTVYTKKDSKNN